MHYCYEINVGILLLYNICTLLLLKPVNVLIIQTYNQIQQKHQKAENPLNVFCVHSPAIKCSDRWKAVYISSECCVRSRLQSSTLYCTRMHTARFMSNCLCSKYKLASVSYFISIN